MNVYLYELKANRKSAIIWLVVMLCLGLMLASFYPAVYNDMDAFIKIMNNYPESIRAAFGMNIEAMGSILGYYSSFPLTFVLICGAIEAMIMGVSVLSKEVREKTADFLFSKPISRTQVITSKILAVLTLLVASNIIFIAIIYFVLLGFTNTAFAFNVYLSLTLIVCLVQLMFMSIGLLISVLLPKVKTVLPISMGTVIGFYVLGVFGDEKLRMLIPFKYFNPMYVIKNAQYELNYLILAFALIAVSITLTYIIYKRKDIHAV